MKRDLTSGSVVKNLLYFSIPYLLSCFLQTFYGLADLFIIGLFNEAASTTGVSVGSQLTHMLTLIIAGLAMGSTVLIGNAVGSKNKKETSRIIGNSTFLFIIFAVVMTIVLVLLVDPILNLLSTPQEAMSEAHNYVLICFAGVPFITAYNVISSIFRGLGDTKSPLVFVAIAGVFNVVLDYILIGPGGMGAAGAAVATISAQAVSVIVSLIFLLKSRYGIKISKSDIRPDKLLLKKILGIGVPVACQDGLIQVAFLVITAIANGRGLEISAAVGIVEKVITFLFLVPSAMLASVSALAAQNSGAGKHDRSIATLKWALAICVIYGAVTLVICELCPAWIVSLFTNDNAVITYGAQYLRGYAFDVMIAGVHFCLGGFFCAYGKSIYSFIQNIAAIVFVRIPGAYLASILFPENLLPMGAAVPLGSLLSAIIAVIFFMHMKKKGMITTAEISAEK